MNSLYKILLLFFLISCSSDPKEKGSLKNIEMDKFIGEWTSVRRVYPFGAILKINKDSTFNYEFGACSDHGISNGTWFNKDSVIILNSNKPDSTLYQVPFDYRGIVYIDSLGNSLRGLKNDFPIIQKKALSTEEQYIEFKNDRLYLKADTLYHLSRFSNLNENMRNRFTRKIKP